MKISNSEKVEKLSILLGRICLPECCKIATCFCVDGNEYESDDSIYDNPKKVIRIFNEEKGNGFESQTENRNEILSYDNNPCYDVEIVNLERNETSQTHVDHVTRTKNP